MFSTYHPTQKYTKYYPNFTDPLRPRNSKPRMGCQSGISLPLAARRGKSSDSSDTLDLSPGTQHASDKIKVWSTTVTRKIGNYILVWARMNLTIFVWQIGIRVCIYLQSRACMFSYTGICILYLCSYAVNNVCLLLICVEHLPSVVPSILWAAWVVYKNGTSMDVI